MMRLETWIDRLGYRVTMVALGVLMFEFIQYTMLMFVMSLLSILVPLSISYDVALYAPHSYNIRFITQKWW